MDKETNIAAISYLIVQLFEYMFGRQFRNIPERVASLGVAQYSLLPSYCFLSVLNNAPALKLISVWASMEVNGGDFELFSQAVKHRSDQANVMVIRSIKAFNTKKKGGAEVDDFVENGEED